MAERFHRLLSLDGPLWSPGSPAAIEKGALLRDVSRNQNLLQLKLKNIQKRPLKAVVLEIGFLDVAGGTLGAIQHSYLDLSAGNGTTFGEDAPEYLADETARGFRFRVASVVFSDGTTWSSDVVMEPIAHADSLDGLGDLKEQFLREMRTADGVALPIVLPTDRGGLWYCTCGALNDASNTDCSTCGRIHVAQVAAIDRDFLQAQSDKAAEESLKRKAKTKRTAIATIAALAVLALAAFPVFTVAIPAYAKNAAYQSASLALKNGDFNTADMAFAALGDYKDSADMVKKTRAQSFYADALKALGSKYYATGIGFLEQSIAVGGYKDAAQRLATAKTELSRFQAAAAAEQKARDAAISAQEQAKISAAGWGKVKCGQTVEEAESLLGAPISGDMYGTADIQNYFDQGFYLNFSSNGRLSAVFFVNGGDEGAGFTKVRRVTSSGIGWKSTPGAVRSAYGSPKKTYSGAGWQRLEYAPMSFRFQGERLVTISII